MFRYDDDDDDAGSNFGCGREADFLFFRFADARSLGDRVCSLTNKRCVDRDVEKRCLR